MNFNEKLIELRKKQGLSQEELGYKLNVTRQTVSKWELGQTTPEMDKLVELSKLFNISIDELINGTAIQTNSNPIIEEQPIIEYNTSREKIIKVILILALIIVLILIAMKSATMINDKWKEIQEKIAQEQKEEKEREEKRKETQDKIYNTIFDTFDNVNQSTNEINEQEAQDKIYNTIFDTFNNINQSTNEFNGIGASVGSEFDVKKFNQPFELRNVTNKGIFVTNILDSIITSNKTKDRKITVKYQEKETQDEAEIKNIKKKIQTMNDYEVTFEYDEQGYINKTIIEKY